LKDLNVKHVGFSVSFTVVIVVLTLFTLSLQTNKFGVLTDVFDMVNTQTSHEKKAQRTYLVSLLAFPILNLYLAINIEVNICRLQT